MYELKPCPHCGGEAEMKFGLKSGFYVQCVNCRLKTEITPRDAIAVFRWNRRTNTGGDVTKCFFCGGHAQIRHKPFDGLDYSYVMCESCYNKTDLYPTEELAVKRWEMG